MWIFHRDNCFPLGNKKLGRKKISSHCQVNSSQSAGVTADSVQVEKGRPFFIRLNNLKQ